MRDNTAVSAACVKALINRHGFIIKKRFGQNFLIDAHVLNKIVTSANIAPEDFVIEVGPGAGALTQALARRARAVAAVEIDAALLPILRETLAGYDNVEVINADILRLDLNSLIARSGGAGTTGGRVVVVANLPYYAATAVIMALLEHRAHLGGITVMLQKEVAARMAAAPGTKDYGALSVAAQFYTEPYLAANVPRNCFLPRPKVDSAVVRLTPLPDARARVSDEALFFCFVRQIFSTRRKTMVNCLTGSGFSKQELTDILTSLGMDSMTRGEALSIAEMAAVFNAMCNLREKRGNLANL
ncbi:MAG: 16S rRNA (adenine(1518)-N(6)/adenine(1519)-N(6))-dimethyltransferase RsmA [Clostridiales bacterium]|jgi:16S rRNA (adenine1518-N6/adenine1519-N6)-dimethyltransferase|nr:16S rRNA (adenine(1518)-N(6)/adenine(1519)-N(6))-dimethyltransferase RsmA [Clostridiales bacterium]